MSIGLAILICALAVIVLMRLTKETLPSYFLGWSPLEEGEEIGSLD
jgi:hypothetical protein